jgi:uncharacterized protein (DUF885 family)
VISLSRRSALLGAVAASSFAALSACGDGSTGKAAELRTLIDRITTEALKGAPEFATSLTVSEAMAGGPFMGRVTDRSAAAAARDNEMVGGWIRDLEAIGTDGLSPTDAISRDVVLSAARFAHAGAPFGYGDAAFGAPTPFVVTQLTGAYLGMPDFLDSQHPVTDQAGADAWLSRLDGFARQITDETARVNADAAKGVIAPDFIIDRALGLLRGFAAKKPEETVLVTGLTRKATEARLDATPLTAAATATVKDKVMPALAAQIAALEALRPRAKSDAGVWALPQGDNYYKAALAYWTTTTMTPDEVHQLGLDMVAQLNTEMDTGLRALGLDEGPVGARMAALGKLPQYVYPNTDAGKEQLIADLNTQMQALERRLPEVFGQLPKAEVEVKRIPAYTEDGAPGGYYQQPAPDGSRPGAYYINLRDTAAWPKWSLATLTYHEAEPGHHLQIALAQESEGLPFIRSKMLWFGAYGEGWALYAEQLADEIGMYADDPAGRLGYLQSMAFRAARLVVDTGLHAKRWTRDQAIDYMVEATGDTRDSVTTEVERYCVWPGQATCYMVGRVDINRLRDRARAELGDRFDIKAFHDTVLLNGAMPLDVLDRVVAEWTAALKAG